VTEVVIDIKPGSDPNSINCKPAPFKPGEKTDSISVAILTTAGFDATTVDPLSVGFGLCGGPKEIHGTGHPQDVDRDGDIDLLLHFNAGETGIMCEDTEACISGKTFGGEGIIVGCDAIRTVGG